MFDNRYANLMVSKPKINMQKHTSVPHSLFVPQRIATPSDYTEARFSFDDTPVNVAEFSDALLAAIPRSEQVSANVLRVSILAGGVGALLSVLLAVLRPH